MNNPLLTRFETEFEAAPFSKIKKTHFIPAIQQSIAVALDEIDVICQQKETPSFENTLEALETCGTLVGRNTSLLFNLNSAETSDALQAVAQEAAPILTKFQNDIRLNQVLFDRIRYVFENEDRGGWCLQGRQDEPGGRGPNRKGHLSGRGSLWRNVYR